MKNLTEYEKKLVNWLRSEFKGRNDFAKKKRAVHYHIYTKYNYLMEIAFPIGDIDSEKMYYYLLALVGENRFSQNLKNISKRVASLCAIDDAFKEELYLINPGWNRYKIDKNYANFNEKIRLIKKLKRKPKKGEMLFSFLHNHKKRLKKILQKSHPFLFENKKDQSLNKMLKLMPKNVKFKKDQKWEGTTSLYTFIDLDFGEFSGVPDKLMSGANCTWRRGLTGHPYRSKIQAAKKMSEIQKGRMSKLRKKVMCIETGEIFDSVAKLTKKYSRAIDVLKGRRKSAGGYTFAYCDENGKILVDKKKK